MFFICKKECQHPRVTPDKDSAYCPDCGKYIENKWYLARCSCCNVKRKTTIRFGEVLPEFKYCPNCGCYHFYVQELSSINFIDINFAVLKKEINEKLSKNLSQSWVGREVEPIKLLGVSLS